MPEFRSWRTFSIFISSTFADMQAERDHLKAFVFPRVKEELQKQRIKLEVVDLRWGVDTAKIKKEDEREATVLKVCLDEIKRCKPFFIGLLGDRYGWVPPEERMKNAVVGENLILPDKGKSVTALEIEFGVLASKEQLNRSVFYFREPFDYNDFSPENKAIFTDEHNPALTVEEKKARISALSKLKSDIKTHFEKQGLKNEGLEEKVKSYSASWDKTKEKVSGLKAWGEVVFKDIIRECENHAEDTWDKVPKNWQEEELALLDAFIEGHTHITKRETPDGVEEIPTFCGREELLKDLKRHLLVKDKENWGLVLTGESGTGKSAVFSMVYKMMQQEKCFVLAHSAGLSPRSKKVLDLLQIWNKQLSDFLGIEYKEEIETADNLMPEAEGMQQKTPELETEKIQGKFRELLFTMAEQTQVVLLIDALDRFELTERAQYMTWLPTLMPGNARMLCTAITGTEQNAVKYHSDIFVRNIDFFTPDEAKEMLLLLCKRQHKNLPEKVETTLLAKKREDGLAATSSPLWLSLAVNILMAMDNDDFEKMKQLEGRGDEIIEDYMQTLALGFPPLPGKLFLSLINKAASIFEKDFTWNVFNYIACSRDGLRESDLESLVPDTEKAHWDALLFANLRRWFSAHMREEGEGMQWNLVHSILRKSLLEALEEESFNSIHDMIALHLVNLETNDSLRITESIYHLMLAKNTDLGLDYYIGKLSNEEKRGATKVLAEAISNNEKGIEWCFDLMEVAKKDNINLWKLAPLFIYNLNGTLLLEGNLDNRIKILKKLATYLSNSESNYRLNIANRFDFGALYEKLGEVYYALGRFDKAMEYFNKEVEIFEKLYDIIPKNESLKNSLATSYSKVGDIYKVLGKFDKALDYYKLDLQLVQELYRTNPKNEENKIKLAVSYERLGVIYQALGKFDQALENLKLRSDLGKELYESNPKTESLKSGLAISYEKLGEIHQALGKYDKALAYYNKYIELTKELYETSPKNESHKTLFAISHGKLGEIHLLLGKFDQALEHFNRVLLLFKELYESNLKNENHKKGLAISYGMLGEVYKALGEFNQALEYFRKDIELAKELYESNPKNESLKSGLAISYGKLGEVYQVIGEFDQALEYFNKDIELSKELFKINPKNESHKTSLAISYEKLGEIYQAFGDLDEALKYFTKEVILFEELCVSNPKNEFYKSGHANSHGKLGEIHQALGDLYQSLECFNKVVVVFEELNESNPENESHKKGLANFYGRLGENYQALEQFDQALEYLNKALILFKELLESNKENIELFEGFAISHFKLAMLYKTMGSHQKGKEYFIIWKKIVSYLVENIPQVDKYLKWDAIEY